MAHSPIIPGFKHFSQGFREPKFNAITKFSGNNAELLSKFKADLKTRFWNESFTSYNDSIKIDFAINSTDTGAFRSDITDNWLAFYDAFKLQLARNDEVGSVGD